MIEASCVHQVAVSFVSSWLPPLSKYSTIDLTAFCFTGSPRSISCSSVSFLVTRRNQQRAHSGQDSGLGLLGRLELVGSSRLSALLLYPEVSGHSGTQDWCCRPQAVTWTWIFHRRVHRICNFNLFPNESTIFMNGNRGNPRAPSAHELELQTSMHELLKALERTLTHA